MYQVGDAAFVTMDPDEQDAVEDDEACEVCGKASKRAGRKEVPLLECDGCLRGYHLDCLDPPLADVPKVSLGSLFKAVSAQEGSSEINNFPTDPCRGSGFARAAPLVRQCLARQRLSQGQPVQDLLPASGAWCALRRCGGSRTAASGSAGGGTAAPRRPTPGARHAPHNAASLAHARLAVAERVLQPLQAHHGAREVFLTDLVDNNEVECLRQTVHVCSPAALQDYEGPLEVCVCEYEYDMAWKVSCWHAHTLPF